MSSFQQIFAYGSSDEEPEEHALPEWFGPSEDELGEALSLSLVAARSQKAVVALRQAIGYSTGVQLDFLALARGLTHREANSVFQEQHPPPNEELPAELLRIGVELADGSRISNLGNPYQRHWTERPEGPLLVRHGGGGGSSGSGRVTMTPGYWLWPLPPPGLLRVFVEWPALDIELSSVELDAGRILEAAERSQKLWPA